MKIGDFIGLFLGGTMCALFGLFVGWMLRGFSDRIMDRNAEHRSRLESMRQRTDSAKERMASAK